MRIICFLSDHSGPAQLTVIQPHRALKKFGVLTDIVSSLPSDENKPGTDLNALIKQISRYDLVLIQRITNLPLMKMFRYVCDLLSKPLVLICDDDYINLEPHNPCYFSTALGGTIGAWRQLQREGKIAEANALLPMLEHERRQGQKELQEAWALPDHVIVTTEELKYVFLPYNKNVHVLENCVEQIFWERDLTIEETDANGKMQVVNELGLATIPAFYKQLNDKGEHVANGRVIRIGYTCTISHQRDYLTIVEPLNKIMKKYGPQIRFILIGDNPYDPWFYNQITECRDRVTVVPPNSMETYITNIRGLDVGIAPIEPTPFNMSKSDLKAIEYAAWGVAPVLSQFVTYSRNFKHKETALLYRNEDEFYRCLEELINNPRAIKKIGKSAQKYVAEHRMQDTQAARRFQLYQHILQTTPRLRVFQPCKDVA
jgi:glycosyltransferase involved in cell wall biosynthesis